VISGTGYDGVQIDGSCNNVVAGNLVGTDATGTLPLGNAADGIEIDASSGNTIGGTSAGAANVISGNGTSAAYVDSGVELDGASNNVVEGNFIGTDATGTRSLGNAVDGIDIDSTYYGPSVGNTIGGASAIAGNLITNNGGPGVVVSGAASIGNQITANRIFSNVGQAIDLGNDGVTYNSAAPRQGPNNLQNFPIIALTPGGRLGAWLGGCTPNTTFRIDLFASAAYRAGGSGEAQDYLGSLEVTTDATGQVTFAIPFSAPAGLALLTATATDPAGNTSEVSAIRRATLRAPSESLRAMANQSLVFATPTGDGITIEDPDAGSLNPVWSLALSVTAGTLTLSSTAGLTGSGSGTRSLSYSGPLSALNAALQGMTFDPPGAAHFLSAFTLTAQSPGAPALRAQFAITDGVFVVDTTADSGPGSLRQAILNADSASGLTVTIDFAIPGIGVQTIEPITPLPPIATSVLIDGASQPGFAGTPLIALGGEPTGGPATLTIGAPDVTVRALAVDRFGIDAATDEILVAQVHPQGITTQLALLDSDGHELVQSDGISSSDPDDLLAQQLTRGTYFLEVGSSGGAGTYTLTTQAAPTTVPFQPLPAGPDPTAIVAGDFTGDGHLDLAVANEDINQIGSVLGPGSVSVLLGNGDGTFQAPVTYPVGLVPDAIVAADFTGNGHLDLSVADSGSDEVSVLLGNGDGTFQPQVTYVVGSDPDAIAAGDFTGHGHLDLAVANRGSNDVSVLLGNGDGTFQPQVTYDAGFAPRAIVVGDFRGDGRLDLAVVNAGNYPSTGTVSVLLGNGDGTFQAQTTYGVGRNPSAIVAGEFTGDGHLDLAVADTGDNDVSVLLGDGDGAFQPQVVYAVDQGPSAIVAGHFNDDGHLELAVANLFSDDVSVLMGNGDGTFGPQVTYAVGSEPSSLVAGDFKGDGQIDLAVANSSENTQNTAGTGTISVLLNNGDGTFQPQSEPRNTVGGSPQAVVAGDFTGSGRLDLAVSDALGVQMLLGNGDGTFQPAETVAAGYQWLLVAGDFNGDGRLDLAVGEFDSIQIFLGNGDGTFQPAQTVATGIYPTAIVAGDFTSDGHLDLAVTNNLGSRGAVAVLLGNGNGTFQPPINYAVGLDPSGIVAGDFTGDGHLDLAAANSGSSDVSVLLGNGNGTFQPQVTYAVGAAPSALVAGDFTGNGRLDLAVAYTNGNSQDQGGVSILLGNGNGTFQPPVSYPVGRTPDSIVAGDFSGDGRTDLAVANFLQSDVSVLLGNGDGSFQPQVTYAIGSTPDIIVAADFDGNGRTDLAFSDFIANTVTVLMASGNGTFENAGKSATAPRATPLLADVNADGTEDMLVVDGAGDILYRRGIPGQPGAFEPPITVNPGNPSRDIAWMPNTTEGPLLASVDAQANAISFYAYRNGGFVQVGSVPTGQLPAQIIAADLSGNGLTDLVVRNAGDGTLSAYFASASIGSDIAGPVDPQVDPLTFLPIVTLPAGIGVSDVQAVDTTGSGALDLVVANKVTGQVSVLHNLGNGSFAPPSPYRAGTELSEIDPASEPEATSLEATAGVVAGPLTPGGPPSLVAIDPGSNTFDVLAGLGAGLFANPVGLRTPSPAEVVRMADFTGNGVDDLAVLTANGLEVYLGDGKGGFQPPTTYAVPSESDGLTVADVTGNGKLDLLVGDAYGDVLVLLGNGDGTFSPYHEANQSVELAVADLTGNGSKDIIYADQGLDRVVVDYGAGNSSVLADQSTGLLQPGAVQLAYLAGPDYPPDLIVANSGSNNVLIYTGLGNGQFGPAVNDGHGYFVGTNPVGITVANLAGGLPDLVVADKGSNEVSILLNTSHGGEISFSAGPRLNAGGSGPVSTVVGNFKGGPYPDLLVTNSGSNNVTLLPGVGQGFFNDQSPRAYSVGTDPVASFVGDFNGTTDLVTINAGSDNLTLVSGFEGNSPVTTTIASGGVDPDAAFAFTTGNGFEDLVVGNAGDGVLSLFEGGTAGLTLTSTSVQPSLPSPTDLAFSALSGGQVQFYAATAGREAATLVALSLGGETLALSQSDSALGAVSNVAQLVPLEQSSLALVGALLTLTIAAPGGDLNLEAAEAVSSAAAPSVSLGQSAYQQGASGTAGRGDAEMMAQDDGDAKAAKPSASAWERFILNLDEALERFQSEFRKRFAAPDKSQPAADPDHAQSTSGSSSGDGPMTSKSTIKMQPNESEHESIERWHSSRIIQTIDAIIDSISSEEPGAECALAARIAATMAGVALLAQPTVRLAEPALRGGRRRLSPRYGASYDAPTARERVSRGL
jgi:hypothetical protein